jgi:5-methylcytosine-specific restriction endonuclease McrA
MDEKALRERCRKAHYDILRRAKPVLWKSGARQGKLRRPGIERLSFTVEQLWQHALKQVGTGAIQCPYCVTMGRPANIITLANYQWDHKVPASRGGSHDLDNLFAVCEDCNRTKGHLTYEFFIALMSEVERWPDHQDRVNFHMCLRTHGVTQRLRFAPKKKAEAEQPQLSQPREAQLFGALQDDF